MPRRQLSAIRFRGHCYLLPYIQAKFPTAFKQMAFQPPRPSFNSRMFLTCRSADEALQHDTSTVVPKKRSCLENKDGDAGAGRCHAPVSAAGNLRQCMKIILVAGILMLS